MMNRIVILVLIALLSPFVAVAQPIPWGDIPLEDLQMTTYEVDPNAHAVVLMETGDVKITKRFLYEYAYRVRIKLLSEAAYDDWGTVSIPYFSGKNGQQLKDVEGITYVLGENGQIAEHVLSEGDVFMEEVVDGYSQARFTMPALEPGAIIEYRYKLTSFNDFPPQMLPEWTFQHGEPTRWSEYTVQLPDILGYTRIGNETNYVVMEDDRVNGIDGSARKYRWAMAEVPALREEPFITTLDDYRARIEFQLSSYFSPYSGVIDIMHTWDEVADIVRNEDNFGRLLKSTKKIRELTAIVTEGKETKEEKMEALYNYISRQIQWNGERYILATQKLNDVLETGVGSATEINLLLIAMMRAARLDANPALLSTRSNGKVFRIHPVISQFDAMMVNVEIGDENYYMDATNPHAPMGLLPIEYLTDQVWIVKEHWNGWGMMDHGSRFVQQHAFTGRITEEGDFEGSLQASFGGYSALLGRMEVEEEGDEAFVEDYVLENLSGLEVTGYTVEGKKRDESTLRVTADITLPQAAAAAGPFLYLTPMFVDQVGENPMRSPERHFPVDLAYKRDHVYSLKLSLPEEYVLEEVPENLLLRLPDKAGFFRRMVVEEDGQLIVQMRLSLSKSKYSADEYHNLRAFYDRVVATQAQQLVFKRASTSE